MYNGLKSNMLSKMNCTSPLCSRFLEACGRCRSLSVFL